MSQQREEIVKIMYAQLKGKQVNPVMVITTIMEIVERIRGSTGAQRYELLVNVLEDVLKGADGIKGTEDDLLPLWVQDGIRVILRSNLLPSIVQGIIVATKGFLAINGVPPVVVDIAVEGTKKCCSFLCFGSSK
jgi:hypothetical protein